MGDPPPDRAAADALLERFRATRDPDDFAALFDATVSPLFRAAVRLTRDGAAAEDVLQETFLAVLRGVDAWDPGRPALPWLTGVLQRKAADAWRRRERERRRPPPPGNAVPDPAGEAQKHEEAARVREALEDLEEPYRRAAVLRWRYGLEPGEIADALGENPGTVRSHLSRARERLERRLRPALLPGLAVFPAGRGLAHVRTALLEEAAALAAPAAGAAGAGTVALVTGGALVGKKVLVAAVALLLIAGGARWLLSDRSPAPAVPEETAAVPPAAPEPGPAAAPAIPAAAPEAPATPLPDELPPPVDLDACDRDRDLCGRTVDEEGTPVPGARVVAVGYPWRRSGLGPPGSYHEEEEGPSTRSAVDGTFVLHLERGDMVDLRATADGYGQGDRTRCLAGERVALVLRREGPGLEVRCRDGDGGPVPGARLRLFMREEAAVYGALRFQRRGVSDGDGRCVFRPLAPGKATLVAEHDVLGSPGWIEVEIPGEGTLPFEVVFPAGRTVTGRVLDAATGAPLPGAHVGSNWVMDRPVTTDGDGRYSFPGWTGKGTSVLTAAAEGYGSVMLRVPGEGPVDFALEPAFTVTGRVLDAGGIPVAGARVVAHGSWKEDDVNGSDRSIAETGGDGRFSLGNFSRRAFHCGVVEAAGHGRIPFEFESPPEGKTSRDLGDLVLPAARAIEGRATGPDGKPLVGVDVNLARLRTEGEGRGEDPRNRGAFYGMGDVRRTDDLGRFRFPDLSPGTWGLKLVQRGAPIVEKEVELPPDRDVLDVVLGQEGRSLTVRVVDTGGSPLQGITVMTDMVFPHPTSGVRGTTSLQEVTGAEGRVRFRALPEVPGGDGRGFMFRVQPFVGDSAPPWAMQSIGPLVPEGQEVTVALRPVARIRGRVLGPDGEDFRGLYVDAVGADGASVPGSLGLCDGEGRFVLRVPDGETVTVRVSGSRQSTDDRGVTTSTASPWRGSVEGVVAPAADVGLRLERIAEDRTLDVLVLDLEGEPVPGFPLITVTGNFGSGPARKTDARGRLHLEGLLAEETTVIPQNIVPDGFPDEAVPPASVKVVPAGQEILLRFRRGSPVEGQVLLPDGRPAAEAFVYYNLAGGGGGSARTPRTDGEGRFRLWFGEEQTVTIMAMWTDGKDTLGGRRDGIRPGTGPVEVRLEKR